MKLHTTITAFVIVLGLVALTVVAGIYLHNGAIFVPILALALQKYTASFFAYFVITLSGLFGTGNRIRIGSIKGDVRRIGLLHTTLEEVGEDEKLGGELTGRILFVHNLLVLDQPVLNYSKDYSSRHKRIDSDYIFDEVRIPLKLDSNVQRAGEFLGCILRKEDEVFMMEARQMFRNGYPRFLDEAMNGSRVLVRVEPQHIWIKGKFVTPLTDHNNLKSNILPQFFKEASASTDIHMA